MSRPRSPTAIERIAGNTATELALTAVAAIAGGPLVALLPVLAKSLASERQKKRVEAELLSINALLNEQEAAIRGLTDSQYKLINEAILAVLQTTSSEKLAYLREAVRNAMSFRDIEPQEAIVLSRIVRDISAEEVVFLVKAFAYERVQLIELEEEHAPSVLTVQLSSPDARSVSGLVSLGVLASAGGTYADLGQLRFMPITSKLLALFRDA